jgi:hypothetical protein
MKGVSKIVIVSVLVIIVAISAIVVYFITAQQHAAKKILVIGSTYPLETSFDSAIGYKFLNRFDALITLLTFAPRKAARRI